MNRRECYIKEIPDFLKKNYSKKKKFSFLYVKSFLCDIWYCPLMLKKEKCKKATISTQSVSTPFVQTAQMPIHDENRKNRNRVERRKIKRELNYLKACIDSYFCLNDEALKDHYFNLCSDYTVEYRDATDALEKTLTRLVSGNLKPYMDALQKELDQKGILFSYQFPLNGEIGFVKAKNKFKK